MSKRKRKEEENENKKQNKKIIQTKSRILHDLLFETTLPWDIIKIIYDFVNGCYFFGTWKTEKREIRYGKMKIHDKKWIEFPFCLVANCDGWNFYVDHGHLWMHHNYRLANRYVSTIINGDVVVNHYGREHIYDYNFVTIENDVIFLIGGLYSDSIMLNAERTIVESYRVSTKTWSILPSMSTPRYDAAAVVWNNNKIYIFGGKKHPGIILSSCEYYDTEKNRWIGIQDMPAPRYGAKAIVWDEMDPCFAVMGGRTSIAPEVSSPYGKTDTVFFYHLSSHSWSIADWKLPQPLTVDFNHFYAQLFFSENVLVIGCSYNPYRGCWMFNLNTEEWTQIEK